MFLSSLVGSLTAFSMLVRQEIGGYARAILRSYFPRRKQLFEKFGYRSTELIEAEETWLGNRYLLVRSRWSFVFERLGRAAANLENESSFPVDTGAEPFRTLVYVAHWHVFEVLRERTAATSDR